jgi:hypothetical protein
MRVARRLLWYGEHRVMRVRVLLPVGVVAAFVLALPSALPASECTPPYCQAKPSNHFDLRKVGHPKTGVVTIRIKVAGPGIVRASGKLMVKAKARARSAGIFTIRLRLTKKGMKKLKRTRGRQLRVRVTFAFTPTGGTTRKKFKKLIFRVLRTPKPAGPEEPEGSKVVVAASATIESGKALIRVFCNGPESCQGTLTLVASGDVTLGSASFALEAGTSPLLRLPLTSRGKKLLNGGTVRSAFAGGTGLHPHEVKLKYAG